MRHKPQPLAPSVPVPLPPPTPPPDRRPGPTENLPDLSDLDECELWVCGTLTNDEASTDAEMIAHFEHEGPMPHAEACYYVAQRRAAMYDPLHFALVPYPLKGILPHV